ncbi:MAG: gluconate 2-dehydrogenase subunit 3 family protein [Bacteroidota bacterium]
MDRREALRQGAFLAGCGLSAGTIAAFVSGCQSGPTATDGYLNSDMLTLLGNVCETIIPETDTPGALTAGVHTYLNSVMEATMTEEELVGMVAGLEQIEAQAQTDHSKSFNDLSTDEREATLAAIDALEAEPNIFRMLRGLTAQVYFTSEEGATKTLAYLPVPGEFIGCYPLSEVGRAWAE